MIIGNFIGIGNYRGQGYSAEYQAVLDRATALGYTQPSSAQKTKQNTLVQSLKDAGIWSLLDVFYVFATDGSSDFATLNWKAPSSYQCLKVNSPSFTSNQGFTGNGTTSYLNTQWNPSTQGVNYKVNDGGMFNDAQTEQSSNAAMIFGAGDAISTNSSNLNPRNGSGNLTYTINDSNQSQIANASSVGFYFLRRAASDAKSVYKDGVLLSSASNVSTSLPAFNIYILCMNENGVAARFRASRCGVFGAGSALTGKQADLYAAWNTYLTSL